METNEITTVVTKRADTPRRTYAQTLGATPNFVIKALEPAQIVATRGLRVYGFALQAGLMARGVGKPIDGQTVMAGDAWGVLVAVLYAALWPAAVAMVWNAAELLAKVDLKFPSFRA